MASSIPVYSSLAVCLVSSSALLAQPTASLKRPLTLQTELGGLVSSSGHTPFWLQTNQFGTVPISTPTALLRGSLHSDYVQADSLHPRPKIDWGAGLELVGQAGSVNQVVLAEAYLKGRWGVFEFYGGRRKQRLGMAESALSSGSFIWSGNALPLPRIEISIPEYAPLGFTKNWLALKGWFAHGWFGNGTYVQRSYLHQKAIYFRLGPEQGRVRLYGGFNQQAQWGGYAPFLETDPSSSFGGQLADSFEAYVNVVLPRKTEALQNLSKFTSYDQNRVGDHRGSVEGGLEILTAGWSVFAYQQHFFEKGRNLYTLRNIEDGLYGIRLLNKRAAQPVQEVVLELFNSGNQGVIHFNRGVVQPADDYFVNGQYPDSWSYRGRTIGTPFISQTNDARETLPQYKFSGSTLDNQLISGSHGITNNRVWALYAGVSGVVSRGWGYEVRASFSRNYGSFSVPFPRRAEQLSTSASLNKPMRWLGGSTLLVSVGYDQGQLLRSPSQVGTYVGLRKVWRSPAATRQ